ncbi:Gram-negative porin, partial [Sutterella sp. KLE1602]|uniref:porin n=1 Tax=Sutterella sp. KLE1602 TaxID=1574262 RepID=UPI0007824C42
LGAFAGSALAADVQLYGVVDLGLNWTQTDDGVTKTDSFSMASGQNSGSRFGLKGTEDLGNGYKVGFNLENSFKADDGALDKGSRLFHRESLLFVQTPFGEISAGRTGALDAGTGRYNLMGSGATAIGTGWDKVGCSSDVLLGTGSRMDNTLTFKSPNMAGFTVLAQASLKKDNTSKTDGEEGSSDAERYYGLGVTYGVGAFNTGLVVSQADYGRAAVNGNNPQNDDDMLTVSGFVNYDFGMIKPMFAAQYWDGGKDYDGAASVNITSDKKNYATKGYGLVVGATAPVVGGTLKVTAGWNDYETLFETAQDGNGEGNNFMVGVGYEYPLSKRTFVYTAAGYSEKKVEWKTEEDKTKTSEVMFGMVHKF